MIPNSARRVRHAGALLLLCLGAPSAQSQGASIVSPGDPAYAELDRLAELGVLDSVVLGQRPYSRREVARVVRAAHSALDRRDSATGRESAMAVAYPILSRLAERFGIGETGAFRGLSVTLIDGASVTLGHTDAVRRRLTGSFGSGIEATINPLAVPRLGRPAPRGRSAALTLSQRLDAAPWLSFQATERLEYGAGGDAGTSLRMDELLLAEARARYRNVALRIGRAQVAWAQPPNDGLFLGAHPPALDLISLAGERPFVLPGPFRHLGPTQATLVVAEVGPSVMRSHSKLLAYKVSVAPRRSVELGATFMNHFGGEGGRASRFGNRLIDFLPFIDIFRRHNYTDTTRTLDVDSDKLLGIDGRVRIDRLGGLLLSGELLIDDFDVHRIPTLFTWDGAQTVALVVPRVSGSPLTVRLSAKHTGVRTYAHGLLANGFATRGRLLGDELGPDAKAFAATLRWEPAGPVRVGLEGRSATYSKAIYASEERGTYFVIRRIGPASNELRDRGTASLRAELDHGLTLTARVAGERIRNFNFSGTTRRDYAAELALQFAR